MSAQYVNEDGLHSAIWTAWTSTTGGKRSRGCTTTSDTQARFDDNGEVPRQQVPTQVNGRTRRQRFAANATADTADSDDDTDLEPDAEPAGPNTAARTADPEAVLDAQDAPPAAHETVEQAVGDIQGDPHANEDPDTNSREATNGSEAGQDTRNQSFNSNPECGLPGPN